MIENEDDLKKSEKDWHTKHDEERSPSQKLADEVASFVGSWKFLIIQSAIIVVWVIWNSVPFLPHFDEYPFILLTLALSLQAAYAAPVILMSQNRQSQRDHTQAEEDFRTNVEAKQEIEQLIKKLDSIELDKLDKIIRILEEGKK